MKVKSKVWLDKGGELVFSSGKSNILKSIEKTGSLNAAAKELKMPYRHAWSYIRSAEKRLGKALLVKSKGGKGDGGAVLTEYAIELLKKFDFLDGQARQFIDKRFQGIFD
jgi:molybdate transport system regulatory protein